MTMSNKKPASAPKPPSDDLLAQLDDLSASAQPSKKPTSTGKSTTSRSARTGQPSQTEQDVLAELGSLAQRPATPSLKPNASTVGSRSPVRGSTATPPARTSEDKSQTGAQRKSNDSARSSGNGTQAFTPATTTAEESPDELSTPAPQTAKGSTGGGGGGWWGGFTSISSIATAAVSQVQKAAAEIQKSEDAQRYLESVRGNVANLRGFGGDLINMSAPTFQSLISTIAPPISSHERLQIHITHDLTNYPTLDPLIYAVFSRVMAQVEGGDLMVVQRGHEAAPKRGSTEKSRDVAGWHDGPWWRDQGRRSVNAVGGLREGTKLVRASAESYATEHFSSRGGVEEVAKAATATLSETNPTRNSEIFLAIQAITRQDQELFEGNASTEKEAEGEGAVAEPKDDKPNAEVVFAIYLHDPVHGLSFSTLSQGVPSQWLDWLEASSDGEEGALPESISEIIESGGVDPREWVSEWIEESISLAVGVVAQRYVARRMGVGEVRKGKDVLKAGQGIDSIVEAGGGEVARAMGGL